MQGIICVHKPPSEGRKFIFGLFGHHRWGLFFSGNLEVIHDFANTASRWMLGLANRVPGSSRGILFYTSSIFVIVVWDAEPIRVTETHQLKIKIVVDSWYLLGCLLSFPHFHRDRWSCPFMDRKKVCKHTASKEFFGSVPHTTTAKIKAVWNNIVV